MLTAAKLPVSVLTDFEELIVSMIAGSSLP